MHTWHNEVRDYELDMQGVVNNANYLHYFEHARHKHFLERGIDFAEWHARGFDFVISECTVKYIKPLCSADKFFINSRFDLKGRIRFRAQQELYIANSNVLAATAVTLFVCIDQARQKPCLPKETLICLDNQGQ